MAVGPEHVFRARVGGGGGGGGGGNGRPVIVEAKPAAGHSVGHDAVDDVFVTRIISARTTVREISITNRYDGERRTAN